MGNSQKSGWFKATASGTTGDNCVEVFLTVDGVDVRDSKDPDGPVLHFTDSEWAAFLDGVTKGEFTKAVVVS